MKNKYRDIDVLIIDDIHNLVGAVSAQQEFFNTFKSPDEFIKYFAKTCIILPNEIKYIEDDNN